jgi:outer membrane receptor for ferrienterochelin and colicin
MNRGVLVLFFCFSVGLAFGQRLLDQRVSLTAEGVTLETALYQLIDEQAINISFSNDILPNKTVSIQVQNLPLKLVLQQLFVGTDLNFREVGQQVLIFRAPKNKPRRTFTISGFLSAEESQERLIGATIYDQTSGKGTVTNEFGFFSLSVPEGSIELSFSFLGYTPQYRQIQLDSSRTLNVSLPSNVMLEEVEVVGRALWSDNAQTGISTHTLDPKMVDELPGLGGEADLLRAAYLLPGVQTGTDGVGGMFVRGGGPGQNLVLIDDVPVYNMYHAAGMLSVFNTQAVRSAKLLKGGFPARYGGRASSVLDIRTKDGNAREWSAQAEAGLLTGRFSAEGPIIKDKSSIFISGRLSYLDWYFKPISERWKAEQGEQGATSYRYYDINAKINYSFSDTDRLYLSFYRGSDRYANDGQFGNTISLLDLSRDEIIFFRSEQAYSEALTWGNTVTSLRWNHVFGNKLFANATFTYSKLAVDIDYRETDRLVRIDPATELFDLINVGQFFSGIEDFGAKIDFDFVPSPNHYIRFGVGTTRRSFVPGALSFSGVNENVDFEGNITNDPIRATENFLYVEDEMTFGDRWLINAGLRLENLRVERRNYSILQPRLFASYAINDRISLKASASSMAQFLHLLSQSGIALPTDLWVSATGQIGPQEAWQFEVGNVYDLGKGFSLTLEGYYKKMDNLITYTEGANILNNWEDNVTQGQGTAYGAEVLLQRQAGKTTGWLGYTLSWVNRQFDLVNLGRPYPFKFDRRHDVKLVLNHKLTDWCTLTGNWVFSTGFAFSLPFERYIFQEPGSPQDPVVIEDFDAINKYRMPFYHRLDLAAQFKWKNRAGEQQLHLGVYNLYNRRNPLYYNLRTEFVNRNNAIEVVKQFVEVPLLPILPSVRYAIKF